MSEHQGLLANIRASSFQARFPRYCRLKLQQNGGFAVLGIDAWVSLFGPAYFAYAGVTVPFMVTWAIACAALAMWNNRESRGHARLAPGIVASRSWAASTGIFVLVAACYIAAHSAVYLLVRHFVRLWL
ncbi:hypothetical protein [Mesorhizobium sp.]|uniref:hypothetical protein n=1 Tax=Mesorhizobium sp. TaxID=1871066 RepID=UPI0025B9CF31|nr:hypothetical protein [Mesorhizobium sp.]